jgi:hypothetical protein
MHQQLWGYKVECKSVSRGTGKRLNTTVLDHRGNEDILEELKLDTDGKKLSHYKQKWLNYVNMMENIRYPEKVTDYRPNGRRPGRPLKRLLDG